MKTEKHFWYKHVPKDKIQNVHFRRFIMERAEADKELQKQILIACREDILFYVNTFLFLYEPRERSTDIPFITYPYQDKVLTEILAAIRDREPLLMQKCRTMGASWMSITALDHQCRFEKGRKFGLMSRSADLVDLKGDADSLFWKLDFLQKYLPTWFPRCIHTRNMIADYPETESNITGAATVEASNVGGRATALFIDELSRYDPHKARAIIDGTADTSPCRIYNFTPAPGSGQSHPSYDLVKLANKGDLRTIRMEWMDHPIYARGHYTYDPKTYKIDIIDKDYQFPPDYKFQKDGAFFHHSPWFDTERNRRGNDMAVREMLCIDYLGSSYLFFDAEMIRDLQLKARPALIEGDLQYDLETGEPREFLKVKGGPIKLWMELDGKGHPLRVPYAKGGDISWGQGATNSCFSAANNRTGEKLLEFACANMEPIPFAIKCVAICRWLDKGCDEKGTFCWERQGPGETFGKEVVRLGYTNVYLHMNELSYGQKISDTPGWVPGRKATGRLLEEYRESLACGDFTNPSELALEEHLEWVHTANGVEHQANKNRRIDPTGATINHGDRTIADALCCKMVKRRGGKRSEVKIVRPGTFAYLIEEEERRVAVPDDIYVERTPTWLPR